MDNQRHIFVGDRVKHFKRELLTEEELKLEPNKYIYTIIAFAKDANTGDNVVVYSCEYHNQDSKIWVRKESDFFSEVDHDKYPNIKQKYRFELLVRG